MNDRLPNSSDGWVPPRNETYLDDAQVLFLFHERAKDGRIRVWFDPEGQLFCPRCSAKWEELR